jgi:hypothetical protein
MLFGRWEGMFTRELVDIFLEGLVFDWMIADAVKIGFGENTILIVGYMQHHFFRGGILRFI